MNSVEKMFRNASEIAAYEGENIKTAIMTRPKEDDDRKN